MLKECGISRGELGDLAFRIGTTAAHGEDQRAGIVINAITVAAIGDIVNAVL